MLLLCDLCGERSLDVRPGLVAWRDPAQPYANVDRCGDVEACKARVEAAGERWPVVEKEKVS